MLIYDGDCSFCTTCAKWVGTRWRGRAQAVPWQALDSDELSAVGLTRDSARSAVWWIDEAGRGSCGHLAIAQAMKIGHGWSAGLGRLLLVPPFRWIGLALYPLIARWRHRLPGGMTTCRM
jgi:predicted DCC family thiol-disulfide oxidoreductase YuxK